MDIKELKIKSVQELIKLAAELRAVLRDGKFQLAMNQSKALKKTRDARKDLARIETALRKQA